MACECPREEGDRRSTQDKPHLTDQSKKARALTILKSFGVVVSLEGRHPSTSFFSNCPPPARSHGRQIGNLIHGFEDIEARDDSNKVLVSRRQQTTRAMKSEIPIETSKVDRGWLSGMVDGEGYIHIRYRSDRNAMYPRLRLFVKSRSIINKAARLMGVNPYARREHGELDGWYASVSHLKALKILRLVGPSLQEASKKCRAEKIIETFGGVGTIHSRLVSSDFFRSCPPPSRIRKSGRVINASGVSRG